MINELEKSIVERAKSHGNMGIDQLQGCIFEEWLGGTLNVNVVAASSNNQITVNIENGRNSVDFLIPQN